MSLPIKLSFCIPTYNRAAFIGETLESILSQADESVEVVIVDGASTDGTPEVVAAYQKRFANLIYYRGSENLGVDRDMAKSVDLARGEYCWLMSSDDLVKPGAISRILDEIKSGADIYLCDVTLCSSDMRPVRDIQFLSGRRSSDQFDVTDRGQFLTYLKLATSNNAVFCYMCVIIFRRSSWVRVGFNEHFNRTGYAHVFTLLSFIKTRCLIKYIPSALVLNRPGNDSFLGLGIEKRYMLDFDGYLSLGKELFDGDPQLKRAFLQVMTREHPWYRLVKLRSAIQSSERWETVSTKLLEFGYSRKLLAFCGFWGRYRMVVNAAVYLNGKFAFGSSLRWLQARV
jgi:O-antigen biosynthesis alpha-1,3-abequosyltransferase